MSSYRDPLTLPWTRALLREQLNDPCSDKRRPDWMNGNVCWREYLRLVLSIKWPSPRVDLFTGLDWPPQFITYTADIHHISAPQGHTHTHANEIIISQRALWLPACCCCCSGCLYGLLNDWLGGASAVYIVFSTTYCDSKWLIQYSICLGQLVLSAGCSDVWLAVWSSCSSVSPSLSAARWSSPSSLSSL